MSDSEKERVIQQILDDLDSTNCEFKVLCDQFEHLQRAIDGNQRRFQLLTYHLDQVRAGKVPPVYESDQDNEFKV